MPQMPSRATMRSALSASRGSSPPGSGEPVPGHEARVDRVDVEGEEHRLGVLPRALERDLHRLLDAQLLDVGDRDDRRASRQVDVFLDRIDMCHSLDLSDRLGEHPLTLSVSDLLLLKLQVFETNDRDYKDALSLLLDHSEGELDLDYMTKLLGGDWGWWRTATMVLERLDGYARELDGFDRQNEVHGRVRTLLGAIEQAPKSRRWKIRARVGERARWYELPEETLPG